MDDLNVKDLEKLLEKKKSEEQKLKEKHNRRKKKMKFGKKALVAAFSICGVLVLFTMVMIVLGKDTTSLTIIAGAGVGCLPILYGLYDRFNTQINLKHMDQNYIEDYDEKNGLY